ncbi:hypothetical protein BSFA1_57940 [Burkholderia sp. SFA1]|nr:hypothetical protein BSFA1_57940 [Burkholderia sp. SFA1]
MRSKPRISTAKSAGEVEPVGSLERASNVAFESKALLESLGVLDDLVSRDGLVSHRAALLDYQRSVMRKLATLHGNDIEAVAQRALSGPEWAKRFPGSRSTSDLVLPFRTGVNAFIASMQAGGAKVVVSATLRPPERAWLMYYSWKIGKGEIDADDVPPKAGIDIEWNHGNAAKSRQAAQKMAAAYGIAATPASPHSPSRHITGQAIDMTISWKDALVLKDGNGQSVTITSAPRDGTNLELVKVGAAFGVIKAKFGHDDPHWSTDGH